MSNGDFKPGDIVGVATGQHAGRRGEVVDHIRQQHAFDRVMQPCAISAQLRRKYEPAPGHLVVRLDACFMTGAKQEDAQILASDLRPSRRFDV